MNSEYSQKEVIDALIETSAEFQNFYLRNNSELTKLKIRWHANPALKNGRCIPNIDGTYLIELRIIPPPRDTAFIVAHEMYHCLLWQQGYPQLKPVNKFGLQIVGDVQSMAYDHYIHHRLSTDFSNGCSHIASTFQIFFDKYLRGKTNLEEEFEPRLLFVYVNCWLSFSVLCNTIQIEQNDLFNWVKRYRTDIVEKGDVLISQILGCNFNNKQNVRDLFDHILTTHILSSHIITRMPPSR